MSLRPSVVFLKLDYPEIKNHDSLLYWFSLSSAANDYIAAVLPPSSTLRKRFIEITARLLLYKFYYSIPDSNRIRNQGAFCKISNMFLFFTGYVLEMTILLCSLPTYVILVRALWRFGEISLVEQQLVMFTAPSNVVLLIYCSTLSARILGFVGVTAVYWLFYDVKITERK